MNQHPLHPAAITLTRISAFLPTSEASALRHYLRGKEAEFFANKIEEVAATIDSMPVTYTTSHIEGPHKVAVLHYFYGGCDWYIIEKDMEGKGTEQAFGFAILNGDTDCAEFGYISIDEVTEVGAELDLYWTPKPMYEVFKLKGIHRYDH